MYWHTILYGVSYCYEGTPNTKIGAKTFFVCRKEKKKTGE